MRYHTNTTGYFNLPEPSLEPEEPGISDFCPICGAKLNLFDPYPLCGVCASLENEEESKWR